MLITRTPSLGSHFKIVMLEDKTIMVGQDVQPGRIRPGALDTSMRRGARDHPTSIFGARIFCTQIRKARNLEFPGRAVLLHGGLSELSTCLSRLDKLLGLAYQDSV